MCPWGLKGWTAHGGEVGEFTRRQVAADHQAWKTQFSSWGRMVGRSRLFFREGKAQQTCGMPVQEPSGQAS